MTDFNVFTQIGVDMSVVRSDQSLHIVKDGFKGSDEADLTLTSYQLRKKQKEMISRLAKINGESQAAVLRAIIDEWCETKLSEALV